jgi:hypothetical protein
MTRALPPTVVANDDLCEAKLPFAKLSCEQAAWKSFFELSAKQSWPHLKCILEAFIDQAKQVRRCREG